jgi:hypothetical protein
MDDISIDVVLFAPLAPMLGVLLFWFIQLLFIESEKYLLAKIRLKHEALCRFTNFLGILFQTICHALGYTVTKSGVSDFYISVNYGRVAPKKEKKGIFEWVANGFLFVGPFFIPAFLLLICLYFLMGSGFDISTPAHITTVKYTFAGQVSTFGTSLYAFSKGFFGFLSNIDLLHPGHFGFMLFLIFLGMGIRPSHIGEKTTEKVDMIYDLRNIWRLITHKPLYILILFLFSYTFFYISLFLDQNWYVTLFSVFGWLSIIAIVAIIIADLIILLIKTTDEITGFWKLMPYITMPISYTLMRIFFYYFPTEFTNSVSLAVMIACTLLVAYLILKYKTNKFKTKKKMKISKKKNKGEPDE